jgi:predicted phosphodiesterase
MSLLILSEEVRVTDEVLLWILSDLHLEFSPRWELPSGDERPCFDVLVIAGDLTTRMERGVAWLLPRVTDRPVVYIGGNHEFYGCDIDRTVEKARRAATGTNVHILQNDAVEINNVLFIGSTLWTDFALFGNPDHAMQVAGYQMNDYRKIRKHSYEKRLRPTDTLTRHLQAREFIAHTARESRADRTVVVSHHGCVREAVKGGSENDILSAAYTSHCPELLDNVDLWIYGHTHESCDFRIGKTRIVSNAKGYGLENPKFDKNFVIAI